MKILAIAGSAAQWLHQDKMRLRALARAVDSLADDAPLRGGILSVGSMRIARTKSSTDSICIWNADYLASAGEYSWGLVRLDGKFGLLREESIISEVLERSLDVIAHRVDGLIVPPAYEWRTNDGVNSLISGRGAAAWDHRIVYLEGDVLVDGGRAHIILIEGPAYESTSMRRAIKADYQRIDAVASDILGIVNRAKPRPSLDLSAYPELVVDLPREKLAESEPPPATLTSISSESVLASATYDDWIAPSSQLSDGQRRILQSDSSREKPIRIIGAAGSGKTLLMQLMAIKRVKDLESTHRSCKILYLCHNGAMKSKVENSLVDLGAMELLLSESEFRIEVRTLLEYAIDILGGRAEIPVYDLDAQETKKFQNDCVDLALKRAYDVWNSDDSVPESVITRGSGNLEVHKVVSNVLVDEISSVIKAQGLGDDGNRYCNIDRPLSRLHGALNASERAQVHDVYRLYQDILIDEYEVLDVDDIALSVLGRLLTPLWERRRKSVGYDFIFVDEAQLFNENEKRLFPLLTKGSASYVPVVLALDDAQKTKGSVSAGLSALGFGEVENQTLEKVFRCSKPILDLAFFVLQGSTDLFGPDFPDFRAATQSRSASGTSRPRWRAAAPGQNISVAVREVVEERRRQNCRSICVVCHSEQHWPELERQLRDSYKSIIVLERRGRPLPQGRGVLVLARPDQMGGQEFDAVVCTGLEKGVVPARVDGSAAVTAALEQQALREIYVSVTRARSEVDFVGSSRSAPNATLQAAIESGLVEHATTNIK